MLRSRRKRLFERNIAPAPPQPVHLVRPVPMHTMHGICNRSPLDGSPILPPHEGSKKRPYLVKEIYSSCTADIENTGHRFGEDLSDDDKKALTAFLATL